MKTRVLLTGLFLMTVWPLANSRANSTITTPAWPLLPDQNATADNFEGRIYDSTNDGLFTSDSDMRYRLWVPPNYNPNIKYPVIVYLHGLGAEGIGNVAQIANNTHLLQLINGENRYKYPCIMIVPQRGGSVNNTSTQWYSNHKTEIFGMLTDVSGTTAGKYNIDPNRISLCGVSWGAMGTLAFLANNTAGDTWNWAAGVAMSGNGGQSSASNTAKMVGLPLWLVHGEADGTVNIYGSNGSDVMAKNVRASGGAPMYTRYNAGGHYASTWDGAFGAPQLMPWLMAQRFENPSTKRREQSGQTPKALITGYRVGTTLDLEGTGPEMSGTFYKVGCWNLKVAKRSATATLTVSGATVTLSSGTFGSTDVGSKLFLNNSSADNWNGYEIKTFLSATSVTVATNRVGGSYPPSGTYTYDIDPPAHSLNPALATGSTSWSKTGMALSSGTNTIGVTAVVNDFSGVASGGYTYMAGNNVDIVYTAPSGDTTAPQMWVTSPSSQPSISTTSPTVVLSGSASDDTGVTAVTWAIDSGASGTATGTNTWTTAAITLDPGNNVITVKSRDSVGNLAVKLVTVMYNQAPVAVADSVTTNISTGCVIDPLANDTDPDAQPLALVITAVTTPSHGTATIYGGNIRYKPTAGYYGSDSFSYTITDGERTSTAQVSVTVSGSVATSGTTYFLQDFSASNSVSSYYYYSAPAANQVNDISAEASGGTWSIDNGALKLVRTNGAGGASGAGLTRFTNLAGGTPQFVKTSFTYKLSGTSGYGTAMNFELGSLTGTEDYNNSTWNPYVHDRMGVMYRSGSGVMCYVVGGLRSADLLITNSAHQVDWYVNASGMNKQYVGSDGYLYEVAHNCASMWVDGTLLFDNVPRETTCTSSTMTDFRVRCGYDNAPFTLTLDNFNITEQVISFGPDPSVLQSWRQLHGLAGDGSQDLDTPGGDGVANLLKYALNMAPNPGDLVIPYARPMLASGTAGLPRTDIDAQGKMVFKFVRRKAATNPEVVYDVKASDNLTTWFPYSGTPTVESLDSVWERVSYTVDPGLSPHSFLRLQVSRP